MKIFGVAGTLGSGKDTVSAVLAEKLGFLHISTSDMLRAAKKKAFGDSPKALLLRNDPFANNLRATRGPGVLIELAYEEYRSKADQYPGGLVASGIRSIGELEKIEELGGRMIFVDADPKIRYERTAGRSRDKNDNDSSFEDFLAMERSESVAKKGDKTVQNLSAMKEKADVLLQNDGNDVEAFQEQAIQSLGL